MRFLKVPVEDLEIPIDGASTLQEGFNSRYTYVLENLYVKMGKLGPFGGAPVAPWTCQSVPLVADPKVSIV